MLGEAENGWSRRNARIKLKRGVDQTILPARILLSRSLLSEMCTISGRYRSLFFTVRIGLKTQEQSA